MIEDTDSECNITGVTHAVTREMISTKVSYNVVLSPCHTCCGSVLLICTFPFPNRRQTTHGSVSESSQKRTAKMKILSISIFRTAADLNDPVPLTAAHDSSLFGSFERQVSLGHSFYIFKVFLPSFVYK